MEKQTDIFEEAVVFALQAHKGMKRKYNSIPFIIHPFESVSIVSTMTTDLEVLAATVLHDTVEDANVTLEDIEKKFGKKVARLVSYSSEDKRKELPANSTWVIRKQETLALLSEIKDIEVKMICLADKISNLRSCVEMKKTLGNDMWKVFNQHDPQMHKWYHEGVAEALKELQETFAYQEYVSLIKKLFY